MTSDTPLPATAVWALRALPAALASCALFALMVLTFLDVILRSTINAPIEFAADLTRLLMAIVVFSAMPLLSFDGKQISVDLLDGLFERLHLRRVIEIAVTVFCGVILLWPAQRVVALAERSQSYGDRMEYLKMPLHYIEWFIAIMTFATALALLLRAGFLIFAPRLLEQTDD